MSRINLYNNGVLLLSQDFDINPEDCLDVECKGEFFVADANKELLNEIESLKSELLTAKMTIAGFESGGGWRNIKKTEKLKAERDWWKSYALGFADWVDAIKNSRKCCRGDLERKAAERGYE